MIHLLLLFCYYILFSFQKMRQVLLSNIFFTILFACIIWRDDFIFVSFILLSTTPFVFFLECISNNHISFVLNVFGGDECVCVERNENSPKDKTNFCFISYFICYSDDFIFSKYIFFILMKSKKMYPIETKITCLIRGTVVHSI